MSRPIRISTPPHCLGDSPLELSLRKDYAISGTDSLRLRERSQRQPSRESPQMTSRRRLVDLIGICVKKFELTRDTQHLAVKILDCFMGGNDIPVSLCGDVAMAALSLASKMEEHEPKIPKIRMLKRFMCDGGDCNVTFLYLEAKILKFFDWNLSMVTCVQFINLLAPWAMEGHIWNEKSHPSLTFEEYQENFWEFIHYFMEISLQDQHLIRLRPSVIASSILYCGRATFGLDPPWSTSLRVLSGNSVEEIHDTVLRLLSTYNGVLEAERNPPTRQDYTPPSKKRRIEPAFSSEEGYGQLVAYVEDDSPNEG